MEKGIQIKKKAMLVFIGVLMGLVPYMHSVPSAMAADKTGTRLDIYPKEVQTVNLKVNQFFLLKLIQPPSRLIQRPQVVNPAIADIVSSKDESPKWVTLRGLTAGSTQLILWDQDKELIATYEIIVSPDTTSLIEKANDLKKDLHEIFPAENISVRSSGEHLTLTGTVTSSDKLTKVLKLAEAYAPDKVINLLQVGGIQQVMLEVRIAEISKSVGNRLGVNFGWAGANAFGVNILNNLINVDGWPANTATTVASSVSAVLGFYSGDPVIVAIDALQEDGLLKVLSRPTLIAQSGQNASFLAGGEFPYPVAQDTGEFTIEWKPFGVGLNFTPTVLSDDTISLVVSPEVSDLDFSKSVSYAGYVVPSINTRRMSTVVELKDNQSFAIAGLLKNNVRESIKKFPILGDIPILGAIFRSSSYLKDETELVVIVTPHLVKAVDGETLPLPTDAFEEPTPFEFMMLGMFEKWHDPNKQDENSANPSGMPPAMEGNFGYIIPE